MEKESFIFNHRFYPVETALLSPNNRTFKYGDGCFETMKMINGEIIFADLHFERFFSSLQTLQFEIPLSFTKDFLRHEIYQLAVKNKHQALARIRLTIFRGDGNINSDDNTPNYIIQSWRLTSFPDFNEPGFSIGLYKQAQKSCDAFSNIKSNNYLPYVMASVWSKKNGFDDAFVLNSYNRIAEATTSNLFLIKDGIIKTPLLSEGCIAGVTRRYLLECFEKEKMVFEQTSLQEEDILDADEVFLTNTGFLMQWIKQFQTKMFVKNISENLYHQFMAPLLQSYNC